jgi:hypothetical protein
MTNVEFVKSFRAYRRGQTAQLGDGEANLLIARGIAVPQQQLPLLETATAQPEARTATVRRRRRKRSEIPQPHD